MLNKRTANKIHEICTKPTQNRTVGWTRNKNQATSNTTRIFQVPTEVDWILVRYLITFPESPSSRSCSPSHSRSPSRRPRSTPREAEANLAAREYRSLTDRGGRERAAAAAAAGGEEALPDLVGESWFPGPESLQSGLFLQTKRVAAICKHEPFCCYCYLEAVHFWGRNFIIIRKWLFIFITITSYSVRANVTA